MSAPNASPKKLSFMSIYFLGINAVIGSGTFLLPSTIYKQMNLMAIVVLLCTSVTVSMIALCYADLSSRFKGSGAAWLYGYHAFGRFTGYELGIFTWFLGCCTLGAEIVALLTTLKSIIPALHNGLIYYLCALILIIFFAVINFFGRDLVKIVNNISAAAKMITLLVFIVVGAFFIHTTNFSPIIPAAALTGFGPFFKHFGAAFTPVFYLFTGFSFIPIAARQMDKPEKNIPRVLIAVMVTVTILDCLMMLVAVGLSGKKLGIFATPLASAFKIGLGQWGYDFIIAGMLISIFGVAFSASFNAPSLIASLANEQKLLPKWVGKKNGRDAPWVGIIMTAVLTAAFTTQSYAFLVSCTVLASFIQYVPSILAVIKFKHSNEFPNHGFKLPGKYTIPILALIVSCYMVTNFTSTTLLIGTIVAAIGAVLYLIVDRDSEMEEMEKLHQKFLQDLRDEKIKF